MKCCDSEQSDKNSTLDDSLDGLLCYCFKHSKIELFDAVKNGREQEIIDDIKAKIKDPGCFCETANPSGKCCLSDISKFVKKFKNTIT